MFSNRTLVELVTQLIIYIYWCSFTERGKIFAKQGVWAIESGPGGLFFTGDGAGGVALWKWLHKQIAEADCTE